MPLRRRATRADAARPLRRLGPGGGGGAFEILSHPSAALRVVARAAREALAQLAASPRLQLSTAATVLSIAAFNFFGVSVTKRLSGGSRAAADAARTLLVWGVSLALGWESFHALQVLGFAVLLAGSSLYNELIRGCLPPVPSAAAANSSLASSPSSRQQRQRASSASGHGTHHHHHQSHRRPSSAGAAAAAMDVEEGRLTAPLLLPQGGRRGALAEGEEEEADGVVEVENLDDAVANANAAASASSEGDDGGEKSASSSRPAPSSSQRQQRRARFAPVHEQPPPATLSTPPRQTPPSSAAGPSSLTPPAAAAAATAAAAAAAAAANATESIAPRPRGIPSSRPLPAAASLHRSHHHHYTLARSMRLFPPAAMSPHSLASPLPSGALAGESYCSYGGEGGSEDPELSQALWGDYGATVSDYLDTPDASGRGG